ncbi:MAG: hypothetical protein JW816_00625 [Candidatus Buchananbacteria bacterium]|nr:hypothetical protein [Candidatus Buchananbacteria bacterium]
MNQTFSQPRYLIYTFLLAILIIANFIFWHIQTLAVIFGLIYLLFYSFIAGSIVTKQTGWQFFFGFLIITSLTIIYAGSLIYFYQFTNVAFLFFIIALPAILFIPYYRSSIVEKLNLKKILLEYFDRFVSRKEAKINLALVIVYLATVLTGFNLLFNSQTNLAIQSPFQVIPTGFIVLYLLASLILVTYILIAKRNKLPLALIIIHTFFSATIATIVYKLGFGFEPFVHQTAEKIIATTGSLEPKTFLNIGQYAIVSFINKLTGINVNSIDKWLLPIFAAITLPTAIYYTFSAWLKKNYALLLALTFLIIPFSGLTLTTPQNLAMVFFVITIFLSLAFLQGQIKFWPLGLLTLATIFIQPFVGITLAVTACLILIFKKMHGSYKNQIWIYFFTAIIFACILPLFLAFNGLTLKSGPLNINLTGVSLFHFVNKFDLFLNLTYLIGFNLAVFAAVFIFSGLYFVAKNKILKNHAPYIAAALVMLLDFYLVKYFFNPAQSINLNQILILIFYTLSPLFLIGFYQMIKGLAQRDIFSKIFLVIGIGGLVTISLYLSYPQTNQYQPTNTFSLSASDIKAVKLIEQTAQPDHLVLANQSVAAAAIKEFGFKKYYSNQYFYSLPNNSADSFYNSYLEILNQSNEIETIAKVINQSKVDEVYFVLNRYLSDNKKIAERLNLTADQIYDIDNGNVLIFKYLKK